MVRQKIAGRLPFFWGNAALTAAMLIWPGSAPAAEAAAGGGSMSIGLAAALIALAVALAAMLWLWRKLKASRLSLEQSRKKFQLVADFSYEWEIWRDIDGKISYVSPSCRRVTGYGPEAFIKDQDLIAKLVFPEDREVLLSHREACRAQSVGHRELVFRIIARDGQLHWINHICRPVYSPDGEYWGRRICNQDITVAKLVERERDRLAAQLRQAQKMEAVGALASGIAHDFNNILGAIVGFAELGEIRLKRGDSCERELDRILRSADRARELVRQILSFSRKAAIRPRLLNLNKEVLSAVKMLERTLPKMVELDLRLERDLKLVWADSNQMSQVIINLAANANQAMAEGGRLTVETRNVDIGRAAADAEADLGPGQYVLLKVQDTGRGMTPQEMDRVFEPFFTTKEEGKGTGLGMSIVLGIVKGHQGNISVESSPGKGTVFRVYLPVATSQAIERHEKAVLKPPPGHGQRELILLVDDEKPLLEICSAILEMAGYRVITATSGEEALERYRAMAGEIDLVVMDLGMPGMGGRRSLRELMALDPAAKVVVASGYLKMDGLLEELEADGALGFVSKPYRREHLLATVRRIMDGGSEASEADLAIADGLNPQS